MSSAAEEGYFDGRQECRGNLDVHLRNAHQTATLQFVRLEDFRATVFIYDTFFVKIEFSIKGGGTQEVDPQISS